MTNFIVQNWDTNQPGANWDSGLQWDVNIGPVTPGDIGPYLALITSKHNKKPKFMDTVENLVQPFADNMMMLAGLASLFDLDAAVGDQQDILGEWIGVSRNIAVPLDNVYFTLDAAGLGFDQGTWYSEFNPGTSLVRLSDEAYRTLLRARIANNQWDGTIPGAYQIWDNLFAGTGVGLIIQDFENMHMTLGLLGPVPDAVTKALFKGGYLSLVPAGVTVDGYLTPTVDNAPYFGFDVENQSISGFDVGAWGNSL